MWRSHLSELSLSKKIIVFCLCNNKDSPPQVPLPILLHTFPVLLHTFPILLHTFPILLYTLPILLHTFPILLHTFPILLYICGTHSFNSEMIVTGCSYPALLFCRYRMVRAIKWVDEVSGRTLFLSHFPTVTLSPFTLSIPYSHPLTL